MRDLAEFVMRSPRNAIIVAVIATTIPMMFWLGAAVVGLVTLRQGATAGAGVLAWAIIPAVAWWWGLQNPGAFIVLCSTMIMAEVLRRTISWQATLLSGAGISVLVGALAPVVMPEMFDQLMQMTDEVFRELAKDAQMEYGPEVKASFRAMMVASFAASMFGITMGALFLARSWQAGLYNPGGWREEFHQLRMSPQMVLIFLVGVFVLPALGLDAVLMVMIAVIVSLVCGVALVHGVIARKGLGGQWLIGFYLVLLLLFPTPLMVLTILALLDSVLDFRSRILAE